MQWFPTGIAANLPRAAKDNFLVRWAHQARHRPDLCLHAGQTDGCVQEIADPKSSGGAKIVRLSSFPFFRSKIETADRVTHVQERPVSPEVSDFNHGRL